MAEVLLASFVLQLLGLVSPLFFQVVVDKVLVHHGLTTLDVLAVGLLLTSIFEVLLGGLRTYVFSHTTNRIDVELGARLFRHLAALPLAYFQARRVGDSVARVRELESIRNFLTGSALTSAIDLFFTFVFLAVMYYYSPVLTLIVLGTIPCYLLLSIIVTPILRARLNEKFNRGAENQAFLVETVTGIETVKAMAVEPQMQQLRWPESARQRVFAYLNVATPGFEMLLESLKNSGATVICSAPGVRREIVAAHSGDRFQLVPELLPFTSLLPQMNVFVSNGGAGALPQCLLAGVPAMIVPQYVEQFLTGRCVATLGAGLVTEGKPSTGQFTAALDRLLNEPTFRDNALAFAQKHADHDAARVLQTAVSVIEDAAKSGRRPSPRPQGGVDVVV